SRFRVLPPASWSTTPRRDFKPHGPCGPGVLKTIDYCGVVLRDFPNIGEPVPRYRAEIHGENFLVDDSGRLSERGFITFRIVEAQDPEVAEEKAVQLIRETAEF